MITLGVMMMIMEKKLNYTRKLRTYQHTHTHTEPSQSILRLEGLTVHCMQLRTPIFFPPRSFFLFASVCLETWIGKVGR